MPAKWKVYFEAQRASSLKLEDRKQKTFQQCNKKVDNSNFPKKKKNLKVFIYLSFLVFAQQIVRDVIIIR